MYYHYQELGRSANTAHLYEAVCPTAKFEKVVFGDTEAEVKLVQDILTETVNEEPITCVLYPSKDAILLSDWIKQRPASCNDKPIRYCDVLLSLPLSLSPSLFISHPATLPPQILRFALRFTNIRLVALDGTYGQANRQWKYLTHALALLASKSTSTDTPSTSPGSEGTLNLNPEFSQVVDVEGVSSEIAQNKEDKGEESSKEEEKRVLKSVKLPVVKLDLEYGTCDSVLAGIMHQPGKDKICTYQVTIDFILFELFLV
jgi:DTW domain